MPPCKARAAKRASTLRKMTSSTLSAQSCNAVTENDNDSAALMVEHTKIMSDRAKNKTPFTADEVQDVINSLHNIAPKDSNIDWEALEKLLGDVAHLSHKDWDVTGRNSERMASILLGTDGDGLSSPPASQIFERILHEGNWDDALELTNKRKDPAQKSWAVLVTGVNGIRKTTAMYQPWFADVLKEAMSAPGNCNNSNFAIEDLPTGHNSFFRQLDHMIITLCNQHFSELYALTGSQLDVSDSAPSKELIGRYSNLKAALFSRYRTLSELLGVLLLREAQKVHINAMCETSGRDVAMFHYIDSFFDDSKYNKLALHFTVNDLEHAKKSVDDRMVREIELGREALATEDVVEVIYANMGGPYGSEVLEGVQADSDRVWRDVVMRESEGGGGAGVGNDWYKAEMRITAHADKPWTIRAVKPDGSLGTEYTFGDPRVVGTENSGQEDELPESKKARRGD